MFKIENLNKREYNKTLVGDLNIELHKGEILGILGDDQSGRKEILDMISGFKKPNNGKIYIYDKPVLGNVLEARRHIGYSGALEVYANFTVQGFIKLMSKVRKIDEGNIEEEINKVLDLVDFDKKLDVKIKDLDEKEQKKLSIATAFIGSPTIILLDDPFFNMVKEESKENIANLILKLKKDRVIIIATDDAILEKIADRVLVLTHKGQIEVDLKEIKENKISLKEKQKELLEQNNIKGKHYDK